MNLTEAITIKKVPNPDVIKGKGTFPIFLFLYLIILPILSHSLILSPGSLMTTAYLKEQTIFKELFTLFHAKIPIQLIAQAL